MDFFKNMTDISSEIQKIEEFFDFANDICNMMWCKKTDCDISKFLKLLE